MITTPLKPFTLEAKINLRDFPLGHRFENGDFQAAFSAHFEAAAMTLLRALQLEDAFEVINLCKIAARGSSWELVSPTILQATILCVPKK